MSQIPRWGIHNGIKYSRKRAILKICPCCKKLFLQIEKGNKKYCGKCRIKAKKIQTQKSDQKKLKNRDKLEHANSMRVQRRKHQINSSNGSIGVKPSQISPDIALTYTLEKPGITTVPEVPIKKTKNGIVKDYDAFHKKLEREKKRLGLKTSIKIRRRID